MFRVWVAQLQRDSSYKVIRGDGYSLQLPCSGVLDRIKMRLEGQGTYAAPLWHKAAPS